MLEPMAPAAAPVVTRRRVLQVGSGVVGALAFGSAGYGLGEANAAPARTTAKKSTTPTPSTPAPSSASYVSQPEMAPPLVTVTAPATNTAPGLIMNTPSITTADHGPLIIDNSGS